MSSRKKSNYKFPATGTMTKAAGSHFLPTSPNANTAKPRSLPRSPISEPAGSGCLQTSPSTITAATVSHPRSPMTEPAGTTFLPTSPDSNTAATGSLPSSPIAKAAGSGFISTSPTTTPGVQSSNLPHANRCWICSQHLTYQTQHLVELFQTNLGVFSKAHNRLCFMPVLNLTHFLVCF